MNRPSAARIARRCHRKMPGVPRDAGLLDEVLGPFDAGLLLEPRQAVGGQPIHVLARREVRDEIAVVRRRRFDLDAQRDERELDVERSGREVRPPPSGARRDRHRPWPGSMCASAGTTIITSSSGRSMAERGQGDRRGRVPAHRLEEDPCGRQLVADEALVAPVGHDGDVVRRQPGRGGLQQGLGSPSSGRNGFGRSGRLRGWSRVPPPPAMMTAYMPPILRVGDGQ